MKIEVDSVLRELNKTIKMITEKDKRDTEKAVQILIAVQCIQFAFFDLEDSLKEKGLYKHNLKKRMKIAEDKISKVTTDSWRVFSQKEEVANGFMNISLEVYNKIDKSVLLKEGKYINIIANLMDIIHDNNEGIDSKYCFTPVANLKNIISFLNIPFTKETFIKTISMTELKSRNILVEE